MVRVRIAPSPTGFLHFGTARTALFNWLFAKATAGRFILRIEDTDKERNRPECETDILEQLKWLGMEWDEFYKQSERGKIYKEYLLRLLSENKAYYCFCAKEELEAQKQSMEAAGLPPKYSGRCRSIAPADAETRFRNGERAVIRFKVREEKISFKDLIRGEIHFDLGLMGDQVIARDLENPLYNFVVVIDDALTQITHVIRAEDHLSNTPKQIVLYEAFGFNIPKFGHLPLILNADRSKMSKRFNDVSIEEYREAGYLKEALLNFMAFLGWHPKENKEVMTIDEIVREFTLERVQKGGAVFNLDKLDWMNAHYIAKLPNDRFAELSATHLPQGWRLTDRMIDSIKLRVKKMSEVKELTAFYFNLPDYPAERLCWKEMSLKAVSGNLAIVATILQEVGEGDFEKGNLESILIGKTGSIPKGEIFWPLRVALSGEEKSPTPFEIMGVLGKNESLRRVRLAIEKCA